MRVSNEVLIFINQIGFMPRRSMIEDLYLLKRLMEYYKERQHNLQMVFIDFENTYDKISREIMRRYLEVNRVPMNYIQVIRDVCDSFKIKARIIRGDT